MRRLNAKELATIVCFTLGTQAGAHGSDDDFEERVIAAILERPEAILAALSMLERTQADEQRLEAQHQLAEDVPRLFDAGEAGNLAPDLAPLLVEFFDYRCAYCAQSVALTDEFAEKYDSRVRLIEYPMLGPISIKISRLAIAVRNVAGMDAYRQFHANMFAETDRPKTHYTARLIITEMGLDLESVLRAAVSQDVSDELAANQRLGQILNVNGTPAYAGKTGLAVGVQTIEQLEDLTGVFQ